MGAFYCAASKVVYLDYTVLREVHEYFGYEGILVIMAHEWGHHVQHIRSSVPKIALPQNWRKAREWQADCYSGAFLRSRLPRMPKIDPMRLGLLVETMGDDGANDDEGYSHGTPDERAGWWMFG